MERVTNVTEVTRFRRTHLYHWVPRMPSGAMAELERELVRLKGGGRAVISWGGNYTYAYVRAHPQRRFARIVGPGYATNPEQALYELLVGECH